VDLVLLETGLDDRAERVHTDVERDERRVEAGEQRRREVQPGRRGRRGAGLARVDGLVPLRVVEGLADVRRERRLAAGLALEPEEPTAAPEVLHEHDLAQALARTQTTSRANEGLPQARPHLLHEHRLGRSAGLAAQPEAARDDPGVVEDRQLAFEQLGKIPDDVVLDGVRSSPMDEQPGAVARLDGTLRDELARQLVVEERGVHRAL